MALHVYSLSIPSSKEECSVILDEIAKDYGIVPKVISTSHRLKYTFEFDMEKDKKS